MNYGSLVPSFYFYKFAESISQSYTSFAAYRAGAIDANGNLLKPESSIDPYEYFVIKLKKIFEQLPPGLTKYQLANYTSALNYFAEEAEKFNIEKEHYIALVEGLLAAQCGPNASYIELLEDMSAGGMAVAGDSPAYNTGGVSGFDPVMAPMQRRKQVADDMYHMFDVSADDFSKISNNQMKEIEYLRRFGIRNPDATLIVRNSKDGNLYTVPKRKKLKEEYGLEELVGLLERNGMGEVNPDKNLDGTTSTEEVLTYFQDRNRDGHPDGQHHGRIATAVSNIFNIGSEPAKQKVGILQNKNAPEGHHAELHARLLSLGKGLDDLHQIKDQNEKHSALSNFLESHVKGSTKSPSSPDRPSGKSLKDNIPDTFLYDPDTKQTVHTEVKTSTAAGTFPTKWPSFGKKLRKSEWEREGIQPTDLEKTTAGRYRIKLPSEVSQELSQEAATQLVRYGKKSGPKTIIKAKDNNFYHVDTADVMGHWASGLDYPSVKRRTRGKEQEQINPETGGHTVELTPLKGFISKAIKRKSGINATRLTMSRRAYETIRSSSDPSFHEHLERLILPHVKD